MSLYCFKHPNNGLHCYHDIDLDDNEWKCICCWCGKEKESEYNNKEHGKYKPR